MTREPIKPIKIDDREAKALLRKVVKGREDYVYPAVNGCHYVDKGEPSCLVGAALVAAGLPVTAFRGQNDRPIVEFKSRRLELTDLALTIFAVAQDAQDGRTPWGEAMREALEVVKS